MATYKYSIDEIKARIIARGSKASKINWLINEAGYNAKDAETTYRLVLAVVEKPQSEARLRALIHFTMGIELECTNVNRALIALICSEKGVAVSDNYNYHHTNNNRTYELKYDGSLRRDTGDRYDTCEIVTPVLRNLSSLKTVCEVINEAGAKVNRTCGFHVHFGASEFTPAQWRRIVINYARLEDIIDGFMPESRRGNNSQWCRTMRSEALAVLEHQPNISHEEIRSLYGHNRYHKVNLEAWAGHRTIEFRQHAGTTNFEKIENWVKFLAGLLTYSIQNETLIEATTIDEIPFLNATQKAYFKARTEALAR